VWGWCGVSSDSASQYDGAHSILKTSADVHWREAFLWLSKYQGIVYLTAGEVKVREDRIDVQICELTHLPLSYLISSPRNDFVGFENYENFAK
jgi:hypothetical protein